MFRLALRNLFQSKARLAMSTAGLALAFLLVLSLDAIVTGAYTQVTAYIDHSGADVWVAQSGVRNMHMNSSALPATTVAQVQAVPGVAAATPISYLTGGIETGSQSHIAYVIGLPPDAASGAPWQVVAGSGIPGPGEAVIDQSIAQSSAVGLGSTVTILDHDFRVSGLTQGTLTIVNSIAFISLADFQALRGGAEAISYVLVKTEAGYSASAVASSIEQAVPGVTASTRETFADAERAALSSMVTDLVSIMNIVGLMIGLAVMALSIYLATLARRAEYGVLKAVGARNSNLYTVVVLQAAISLVLALGLGLALTALLSVVIPTVRPGLDMEMSLGSTLKVAAMALGIAVVAAALPVRQVAGLDPALVFRRKVA